VITGCARSGTTLLKLVLDSHPEVAMLPGTEAPLLHQRSVLETDGRVNLDRFVEAFWRSRNPDRWGFDREGLREILACTRPETTDEAVGALAAWYARRRGKPRYGHAGPDHVTHMAGLGARLPEARMVHLIRDGRDVAAALCDVDFGTSHPVDAAVQWRRRVRAGRRQGAQLASNRYLEIRYEELVAEPERTLRALCRFLDLGFHSAMLRHHEFDIDEIPVNVCLPHQRRLTLPITPGVRDWRRDMKPSSVARVEQVAADTLSELGYPLSGRRAPWHARLRVAPRIAVATARDRWRPGRVKRIVRMRAS